MHIYKYSCKKTRTETTTSVFKLWSETFFLLSSFRALLVLSMCSLHIFFLFYGLLYFMTEREGERETKQPPNERINELTNKYFDFAHSLWLFQKFEIRTPKLDKKSTPNSYTHIHTLPNHVWCATHTLSPSLSLNMRVCVFMCTIITLKRLLYIQPCVCVFIPFSCQFEQLEMCCVCSLFLSSCFSFISFYSVCVFFYSFLVSDANERKWHTKWKQKSTCNFERNCAK